MRLSVILTLVLPVPQNQADTQETEEMRRFAFSWWSKMLPMIPWIPSLIPISPTHFCLYFQLKVIQSMLRTSKNVGSKYKEVTDYTILYNISSFLASASIHFMYCVWVLAFQYISVGWCQNYIPCLYGLTVLYLLVKWSWEWWQNYGYNQCCDVIFHL